MKISNFAKSFYFTIKTPLKPSSSLSRFFCKHSSSSDNPSVLLNKNVESLFRERGLEESYRLAKLEPKSLLLDNPDLYAQIKKVMYVVHLCNQAQRCFLKKEIDYLKSPSSSLRLDNSKMNDLYKNVTQLSKLEEECEVIDSFYEGIKDRKAWTLNNINNNLPKVDAQIKALCIVIKRQKEFTSVSRALIIVAGQIRNSLRKDKDRIDTFFSFGKHAMRIEKH